jgi:hypothetical protein
VPVTVTQPPEAFGNRFIQPAFAKTGGLAIQEAAAEELIKETWLVSCDPALSAISTAPQPKREERL